MIIKHLMPPYRWSELDQLRVDDLVNNPLYLLNPEVFSLEVGVSRMNIASTRLGAKS